jgi:hypothetical protein
MKKLIVLLAFVTISSVGFAQIGNLFKPIDNVLKVTTVKGQKGLLNDVALRLNVGVSTTQSTWNKETKKFDNAPMAAVGFGLGIQKYTVQPDGSLFNNYGANLLLLVPTGTGNNGMAVGLFGNVSIFQLGVDYNLALKKVSLDTGITLKF